MIVKVQVPLASNIPRDEWRALIYNRDRSFEMEMPITDDIITYLKGRPKAYFHINLREGNPLFIESEAPWQNW